jgi:hypothetical protein
MDGSKLDEWDWDDVSSFPQDHLISEIRDGYWSGGPRDLACWRNAMELVKTICAVTKAWPSDERYGLTSQVRRASVSVPANIAEGLDTSASERFCTICPLGVAR